jgi:CheY-like chemotaxis protein
MSKELARRAAPFENNSPQRILVVDDNHIVRQANLALLASAGYDVDGAKDGAEGWN